MSQVEKRHLTIYLLVTFALSWFFQIVAGMFVTIDFGLPKLVAKQVFSVLLLPAMFGPLIGVWVARGHLRQIGWRIHFTAKQWSYYLLAWLAPTVLTISGATLYFLVQPGSFSDSAVHLPKELLGQLHAQGISTPAFLAIQIAQAIILAPFINMFVALGEEVGWRGFLSPILVERFGRRGLLYGGVIWGIWHWPIMVFGYEYGTDYPGFPILGWLIFLVFTIGAGIILSWLYQKTGSIWAPALMHGGINALATIPPLFLTSSYDNAQWLGPTVVGLIGGLPLLIWAITIYRKLK